MGSGASSPAGSNNGGSSAVGGNNSSRRRAGVGGSSGVHTHQTTGATSHLRSSGQRRQVAGGSDMTPVSPPSAGEPYHGPPAADSVAGGSLSDHGGDHLVLNQPYTMNERSPTMNTTAGGEDPHHPSGDLNNLLSRRDSGVSRPFDNLRTDAEADNVESSVASTFVPTITGPGGTSVPVPSIDHKPRGEDGVTEGTTKRKASHWSASNSHLASTLPPVQCLNPAAEVNARLDTQVEVRVYPCNNSNSSSGKKKYTQFTVKPEGVIIQGTNRHRSSNDLGAEYAMHIGRKLQRYELSDTRACQLLVTTHNKSFWVVPAPEAFSRHSGTCRLLGDRKHPLAPHTLQVGDFLRVGSVGVVVIETHDGEENRVLSEEKIQKIMKDTTASSGGFLDLGETDGENSDDSVEGGNRREAREGDAPVCYMCFDEGDDEDNPLITPCKCLGDTRYVHVNCLRKWHTAEADNQICFLSSVDATCSVCKSTFKSDFKLKDGRMVKLFKSSLEPPYVSLLVATKHEMAQRLFNTRFQLSFSTLLKPDGRNGTRPLLLGRSSGSDMVLDYRTVSARHASIRFKNGEFIFTDAGSSNGSYLYLRRPVELTASQPVQFRLGRSMISMKVVNKWNRRLLRAVRRTGQSGLSLGHGDGDDQSVGSNDGDVRITNDRTGNVTRSLPRRTRESIMDSLPPPGHLSQNSNQHIDLLFALAYPKRSGEKEQIAKKRSGVKDPPVASDVGSSNMQVTSTGEGQEESKVEEPDLARGDQSDGFLGDHDDDGDRQRLDEPIAVAKVSDDDHDGEDNGEIIERHGPVFDERDLGEGAAFAQEDGVGEGAFALSE